MTREEAVKQLTKAGISSLFDAEDLYESFFEKPVVPKYVADWYEENKDEFYVNLHCLVWEVTKNPDKTDLVYLKSISDDFRSWYIQNYSKDALQILVNMHQHGYYVKKEPRYKVTFKGLNINKHLCCNWTRENWYLWCDKESKMRHTSHTRKELEEAGFGWVFDCDGIEVDEVIDED